MKRPLSSRRVTLSVERHFEQTRLADELLAAVYQQILRVNQPDPAEDTTRTKQNSRHLPSTSSTTGGSKR
jgi:hypothetical protein